MTTLTAVLCGMAGGLLPDAIRVVKERYNPEVPPFLRSPKFYAGLLVQVLLGGFAAWLLQSENVKAAVIYGFAAPELLTRLGAAGSAPAAADSPTRGGGERIQRGLSTLGQWWRR
jgi:hypothetical protein